jgi:rubrerythrin
MKKEEAMSVLDDAMTLERRAMKHYGDAKKRVNDPGAVKVLELLADEERKHAEALEAMKGGRYKAVEFPSLLQKVRGFVEGAVEGGRATISTDASLRDVLHRAMEIEQATEKFYNDHAQTAEDENVQSLFAALAFREQEHYLLVSSLSEYFNRPSEWVESAEFGLRPEY